MKIITNTEIIEVQVNDLKIHPEVEKVFIPTNLGPIQYTMNLFGQHQPITIVTVDDQKFVVDGVLRFLSSQNLQLKTLKCIEVEVTEDQIRDIRIRMNQKVKTSILETCHNAEHILGILGKSQGKKRDLLGFNLFDVEDNFGLIGKDRFELTCVLLNIEMKPSNLRKLMNIYWDEDNQSPDNKVNTINRLNRGDISINQAHALIQSKKEKVEKSEVRRLRKIEGHNTESWYKLYNKSSMVMDEIEDNSVNLFNDSHPYFGLREYRNQDELIHGQEKTVKEYTENFIKFCEEKKRKLIPGGVMVTILGDTYLNGYKAVCSRVEIALEDSGWELIDCNIWEKSNQKFTPHPLRFSNSYERIIVARKPGGETTFQEIMRKSSTNGYEIKPTSNGGVYIAGPESCITNVINTSVHPKKELRKIEDEFRHDAPCPEKIYQIFLEAYSKPGDLVVDGFVGTGTVGVGLTMGRNIIGYDVDPVSIKFAHKRFKEFSDEKSNNLLIAA